MEPTPIFTALADAEPGRADAAGERHAHDRSRSVTDLLRALRDDEAVPAAPAPPASRPRHVGEVPDLLSFPAPRR